MLYSIAWSILASKTLLQPFESAAILKPAATSENRNQDGNTPFYLFVQHSFMLFSSDDSLKSKRVHLFKDPVSD